MKKGYNPQKIEGKWQKIWAKQGISKKAAKNGKFYILDMFPYPSGDGLHVGHVENFTATDILARFKRFQGYDVLRPMGWDAFGLPAENFAIKTGIHPSKKTLESIKNFKRQMQSVGLSYDWNREINTSSPEYYRWTQWMFLFLYKNGLAYKKKAKVNWCDKDATVLANEQVIDGKCDRCGSVVVQKDLKRSYYGGNSFDIGDFDGSVAGVTSKAHLAINATLFRPYLWEVKNPLMLLSALESTYIMILTAGLLFRLKFFGFFKLIGRNPLLLFAVLFALFFAFSVGLSTPNFGALSRLKIPCIPFFVASLFVLRHLYEKNSKTKFRF